MSRLTNYAGSVLLHSEKVQELPGKVQEDIAGRIGNYIKIARASKSEATRLKARYLRCGRAG